MPWQRLPNELRLKLPNWPSADDKEKVHHQCSPGKARRIALRDPNINCFFFVRQGAPGLSDKYRPKDAVFFSLSNEIMKSLVGGRDPINSPNDCDLYVKRGMVVAYYDPTGHKVEPLATLCTPSTGDGAAVDVVCIFAANIVRVVPTGMTPLDLEGSQRAIAERKTIAVGNAQVCALLKRTNDIKALQEKGISVLLSVMNHHQDAAWSEFSDKDDASQFAKQLNSAVEKYGLDGIDIDDEYSLNQDARRDGRTEQDKSVINSLAMLAAKLRYEMPRRIISKALFEDNIFFGEAAKYIGKGVKQYKLEDILTYGWEMSYWEEPERAMGRYVNSGPQLNKKKLLLGFKIDDETGQPRRSLDHVDWLKDKGYGGAMVFGCEYRSGQELIPKLVNKLISA